MPQITLEYSNNIIVKDLKALVSELHQIIAEMLPAEISSCKTRIIEHSNYVIGSDTKNSAFIHLSIRILKGRTEEVKNFTAHAAANYLRKNFAELNEALDLQISVEIGELPIYVKA